LFSVCSSKSVHPFSTRRVIQSSIALMCVTHPMRARPSASISANLRVAQW
jgi:hypothetical protein